MLPAHNMTPTVREFQRDDVAEVTTICMKFVSVFQDRRALWASEEKTR